MTIQKIKALIQYGDIKTIADMSGYSISLVEKIINGRAPKDNSSGIAVIKSASDLMHFRQNVNRSKRQVRSYNRKNVAS